MIKKIIIGLLLLVNIGLIMQYNHKRIHFEQIQTVPVLHKWKESKLVSITLFINGIKQVESKKGSCKSFTQNVNVRNTVSI